MKQVWYVQGADSGSERFPEFFATKMLAEEYARLEFPNESPDTRYARIFHRNVWEEADMQGESK